MLASLPTTQHFGLSQRISAGSTITWLCSTVRNLISHDSLTTVSTDGCRSPVMADVPGLCKEASVVMQRVAPLNDLIIKTADDDEFAVSKPLLAAASVVLANMFADVEGGISEGQPRNCVDSITFLETTKEVVLLLNHVYAGAQFQLMPNDIGSCLRLAAKYDMPRLLSACHKYLDKVQLGLTNLPGWLAAACGYQVPRFTARCVEYAAGHLQSIIDRRVEKQLSPTAWLEDLPPSTLVEILQLRTSMLGCLATTLGKRDRPLSTAEIVQLEKRPRSF